MWIEVFACEVNTDSGFPKVLKNYEQIIDGSGRQNQPKNGYKNTSWTRFSSFFAQMFGKI